MNIRTFVVCLAAVALSVVITTGTHAQGSGKCHGGTYDTCAKAMAKAGWSNRQASNYCSKACAK